MWEHWDCRKSCDHGLRAGRAWSPGLHRSASRLLLHTLLGWPSAVGLRWVSIHFSFPYTLHVWAFRWLTPTAALRTQGLASPGKLRTGGTGKSLCCLAYLVLIFCLPYQNTNSVKQRLGHFWCILNTQNSSWNSADTHKSSYRVSEWVSGGTPALGFLGVLGPCKAKGHPSS